MREGHEPGRHGLVMLDGDQAGMLREALVQYAVDVASWFTDAPVGERRAGLRRLVGIAGALDAIGWDAGAGQIEPLAHRAVLAAALHAQVADLEGRDTPSETGIVLCERLLAIVGGDGDACC